ncbi:MAG: arylamine N-acetyltransferase [Solirubrobacteraceae bacterium]
MFELPPYLERIGLVAVAATPGGPPGADAATLRDLHRAHVISIPFENLDPLRGAPASVELGDLQRKLVRERRGGFCFEHNTLLAAALVTLGYEVEPMLGRVGFRQSPERARSHMLLRVRDIAGGVWHADVGFGAGKRTGTLLEPIPFGPGGEYEQSGWRYKVEPYGSELVLMAQSSGSWSDMYSFVPEPVPQIDIETSNWFASTHPRSIFTRSLIIASHAGGSRSVLSDDEGALTLLSRTPTEQTVTGVERAAIPSLLAQRFGLPGWTLDPGTGVPVPAG